MMKIAIIGSGISGLSCAYFLHNKHDITVFEAQASIGGHTATKQVCVNNKHYEIDTGFIVFNDWTYPNFIRLLQELKVQSQPTDMSFSVRCDETGLEYGGSNLNSLFAQRRNFLKPSHWKMLADILRFNREAVRDLDGGYIKPLTTLSEYLSKGKYGQAFIYDYLVPMTSAIWSSSTATALNMPCLFFVRFFKNHGLLSINDRPQWRVIKGGSCNYLESLTAGFKDKIHAHCPVESVVRDAEGVVVTARKQSDLTGEELVSERFDQVILACHSDQALALLQDPSAEEENLLRAIPYKNNEVVLHTDTNLLPKRRAAWSSWNYLKNRRDMASAVLTYNMNILQGIQSEETFCVTLNATNKIDPDKILGRYSYSHPEFSPGSIQAANDWGNINGVNNTWFCGAYWGNGFHEDGLNSALKITKALGVHW